MNEPEPKYLGAMRPADYIYDFMMNMLVKGYIVHHKTCSRGQFVSSECTCGLSTVIDEVEKSRN